MKHVVKSRPDVFVSADTNNQTGGSVQNHLKSTDDLCRDTVHDATVRTALCCISNTFIKFNLIALNVTMWRVYGRRE